MSRTRICRISRFGFLLLVCALGFSPTYAQQLGVSWTDRSGNWSNPANWSTVTVPNHGGGTTYMPVRS